MSGVMLRLRFGLRCRSAGDADAMRLINAGDAGQPAGEEPHPRRFSSLLHRWRAGTTRLGAAPSGMSMRSMGESFRLRRLGVRGELLVGVLGESTISITR